MANVTIEQLRSNALLGAVVDAIAQTRFGGTYFVEWYENECNLDDVAGTAGTLQFLRHGVVGAFCDYNCGYRRAWLAKNQDHLYCGMPPELRAIVEEIVRTHPHMMLPVGDEEMPLATAVLWSAGGTVKAAVPWPELMENGGHILRKHFLSPEEALAAWVEDYGLTPPETAFAQRVFDRVQAARGAPVELSDDEALWVESQARSLTELRSCLHFFSGIGVSVPVKWERVKWGEPGTPPDPVP